MGKRMLFGALRVVAVGILLLLAAEFGKGELVLILFGVFGEAEPLTEGQSVGIGLLLWLLVPYLLAAVYLLLRGRNAPAGEPVGENRDSRRRARSVD